MAMTSHGQTVLFRKLREGPGNTKTRGRHAPSSEPDQDSAEVGENVRPIQCALCSFPLTTTSETTLVNGRHRHVFFNPAGIVFDIRCFYQAPGVRIVGEKSSELSWFAGFVWQLGLCRSCRTHLGWFFSGPSTFHALIVEKLIY